MTQQTLEPGTMIFNATGRTAEVALDRRAKGGKLWAKGSYTHYSRRTGKDEPTRFELHGLWLVVNEHKDLADFCGGQQREALAPLRAQVEVLNRRLVQIKDFAILTMMAVAGVEVSDDFIARIVLDIPHADMEQRREIRERLGNPTDSTTYYATYLARLKRVSGIGGPVLIYGSTGMLEINPPAELKEAS